MIRFAIISFFVLLFVGPAFGQAPEKLFVGNCSFSGFVLVSDSTYTGDIIRFDDRMGDGYNLTQLQAGDEIFDGRGLVFEIDVVNSATNFTADVTVTAKVDRGFEPFGSGQVYRPTAAGLIPPSSQEQAGLSPTQKARIDRHNVVTMQSLIGDRDTVYSITNVSDTSALSPQIGYIFVNSTADTLGVYDGDGWVLFYGGGGSTEQADGLTILGAGTGGDPFRVDTALIATTTALNDSVANVQTLIDSLSGIKISFNYLSNIQIKTCETTAPFFVTGRIDDPSISVGDDISGDITWTLAGTAVTYIQEEDGWAYYEIFGNLSAGVSGPTFGYGGVTLNPLISVLAGFQDTVTVFDPPGQDSILVTRVCGTEVSRDTIASGGGGGSGIDTLYDYTALRAYAGSSNAIFVNKGGIAGLFRRVAAGADNGGTLIVASNSVAWKRDYTGEVSVTWFGAIPNDDIADEDAITAASEEGSIFFPPGEYTICDEILLGNPGLSLSARGIGTATLKRCDGRATTVKADVSSAESYVTVVNADTFQVGDWIHLIDADKPIQGRANVGHSAKLKINEINGDTLVLNAALNTAYSSHTPPASYEVGDIVFKAYDMITNRVAELTMRDLEFDGNKDNYEYTLSWTGPKTMTQIGRARTVIENCAFKNAPCENIFHEGELQFINNKCENLNGSALHYSNDSGFGRMTAIGNILINVSIVGRDTAGHNEAAFVCSSQSDSITLMGNKLLCSPDRRANGFFGNSNSNDDNIIIVANNHVENAVSGIELNVTNSGPAVAQPGPVVQGNVFINVEKVLWNNGLASATLYTGNGYINTVIASNSITNGRIQMRGHLGATISSNVFRVDSLVELYNVATRVGLIDVVASSYTTIQGNSFNNDDRSGTKQFFRAINVNEARSDDSYSPYGRTIISGNMIKGFNCAIGGGESANAPGLGSHYGVYITNNTIYQRDSSSANSSFNVASIIARPGYIVNGNSIFNYSGGGGIITRGIAAASAGKYNGPIVMNNVVMGGARSIEVGRITGDDYNITCINNIVSRSIEDNTTAGQNNIVYGNVVLPVNQTVPLNDYPLIRK